MKLYFILYLDGRTVKQTKENLKRQSEQTLTICV